MWRAAMLVLIVLPFVAASGAAQPPAPQGSGAAGAVAEWTEVPERSRRLQGRVPRPAKDY